MAALQELGIRGGFPPTGFLRADRPAYLRAATRTNRVRQDPDVENRNLPLVLLFREALRIKKVDKKKAIGLLDEEIRVPCSWIKSIPLDAQP